MKNQKEFYAKLKKSLDETTKFPAKYMYKFIVPNQEDKIIAIEDLFNFAGAVITTKSSKTGKYKSITILLTANSSDEIISKYKQVATVDGVISL